MACTQEAEIRKLKYFLEENPVIATEELLKRSVRRSLTDEAGVIISGGVDSTLVSAQ